MKFIKYIICMIISGFLFIACEDYLEVDPKDNIAAENLFIDEDGFESGLNSLYVQMRFERERQPGGRNAMYNLFWYAGTDNVHAMNQHGLITFANDWGGFTNSQTFGLYNVFVWLYEIINNANTIIDFASNPDLDMESSTINRIIAEARTIRGWAYRHLTYTWGDVPVSLQGSSGENIVTDWERTSQNEVFQIMVEDFLAGTYYLPATDEKGTRVTSAFARHYLAETYLALGENTLAEAHLDTLVNALNSEYAPYKLITSRYGINSSKPGVPFMDMFIDGNVFRNQGNDELIFAFPLASYVEVEKGNGESYMRRFWTNKYDNLSGLVSSLEYGGRGMGRWALNKWGFGLYEEQDDRYSEHAIRWYYIKNTGADIGDTVWTYGSKNGPTMDEDLTLPKDGNEIWLWPTTRKWEYAVVENPLYFLSYQDQNYLRLGESYLLFAEAQFKNGRLNEAANTLNAIRTRSNATTISAGDVSLEFILEERSRELISEEHRWHTLYRIGLFDQTNGWYSRTRAHNTICGDKIQEYNKLFPIPQEVIDANLNNPMTQNPGY